MSTKAKASNKAASEKIYKKQITIHIQPFDNIKNEYVKFVYSEISNFFPFVKLNKAIPLPTSAFYKPRNRYRADSLISFLDKKTITAHISIGLTSKDISTTKGKYYDWGVMGLGYCPGKACVVSTFRLSKKDFLDQLFKVSIHELGHTQGLSHCKVKTCFMRDAEGGNSTNEETDFCPKCKRFLISKGWKFKNKLVNKISNQFEVKKAMHTFL